MRILLSQAAQQEGKANSVLVIGAQGVLGGLLVGAFARAGWNVLRGGRRPDASPDFRHVNLDEPETLAVALEEAEVVVSVVPDSGLMAERMVLDRGGILINVSAMPAAAGEQLRSEARGARGTVMMNAGIAPGVTNLIAADLLAAHPEADEIELVFTVSTKSTVGRAGSEFAHRGLTAVARHRTAVIPLPQPYGRRRCLGFAEPDRGWLGAVAEGRTVSPYVCIAERMIHSAMLATNAAGMIAKLPRTAFAGSSASSHGNEASTEAITHWIAVLKQHKRIGARTLRCQGDYRCAAESSVVFARALVDGMGNAPQRTGVFDPQELLNLEWLDPLLRRAGITIVDQLGRNS